MLRFIAFVWDTSDTARHAVAQRVLHRLRASRMWSSVEICAGVVVLHSGKERDSPEIQVLPGRGGVLLGRIFTKPTDERPVCESVVLGAREVSAIVRTAGRRLIDDYWGRYVAFLRDEQRRHTWVLRDPTGHLPCFATTFQGVSVYFSHVEDCICAGLGGFSINWQYVAAYLCNWRLQNRETGLDGISQVHAGECVEHRADGTTATSLLWVPGQVARAAPVESFDAAVVLLRRTTQACIWAWASCHSRIVHSLSGGLDSSIVLGCLHTAPSRPTVTCIHYFDESAADADERAFARSAAAHFGCELIERRLDASTVALDSMLSLRKFPRPAVYQYSVQYATFENQLACERDASALFKGIGGDQVFFQGRGTLAVADSLRAGSVRRGWQLAARIARAERTSVWSVFGAGLRRSLFRSQRKPLMVPDTPRQLVSPEVVMAVRGDERWIHPWIASAHGLPEGKLQHIETMIVPFDYYDPLQRLVAAERVHPLFSQPVMEACIRIPTYLMAAGGQDRAVARRAFANELPKVIVSRSAKGGFDSYLQQLLQRNLPFMRALMLDGLLVRERLLDRRRVETLLAAPRGDLPPGLAELFVYHLSTEAWLRSWSAV